MAMADTVRTTYYDSYFSCKDTQAQKTGKPSPRSESCAVQPVPGSHRAAGAQSSKGLGGREQLMILFARSISILMLTGLCVSELRSYVGVLKVLRSAMLGLRFDSLRNRRGFGNKSLIVRTSYKRLIAMVSCQVHHILAVLSSSCSIKAQALVAWTTRSSLRLPWTRKSTCSGTSSEPPMPSWSRKVMT